VGRTPGAAGEKVFDGPGGSTKMKKTLRKKPGWEKKPEREEKDGDSLSSPTVPWKIPGGREKTRVEKEIRSCARETREKMLGKKR